MEYVVSFDGGGVLVKAGGNDFRKYLNEKKVDNRFIDYYFRLRQGDVEKFSERFNIDINEIYKFVNEKKEPEYYEDAVAILQDMRRKNIHIICMSNSISLFEGNLQAISKYFDKRIDSYKIGMLKPDVRMFQFAEKGYHRDTIFIHVGDSVLADIVGANKANWWSILIDRKKEYISKELVGDQKPDYIINDLYELNDIVKKIDCKKGGYDRIIK